MCDHCGCGEEGGYRIYRPGMETGYDHGHHHDDADAHSHAHTHSHGPEENHQHQHLYAGKNRITIETDILHQNNLLAQRNRGYLEAKGIIMLNLVSSPGSGKTTLLERTIITGKGLQIYVIEGDQQTSLDADRIQSTGAPVVQVNTGNGCHLDADMIHTALKTLQPAGKSLLIVENVGNLVCPALFDLGEAYRIVVISTTEGADKPLKYPSMFESSQICLLNKTDLLPYVDFDPELFSKFAHQVNPSLQIIPLSAKTGDGFDKWMDWIRNTSLI